ncbi:MAG: hypothetical protein A2Y89_06915 [Chloroflexi bacterium RBG_13_51_18]|nr:MAG: hypothetical protein A2Y89_06915 [Chloroflexi bacterium RBG_13_51_18]
MKGEKGQALPLAIMALTIGTLLIVPFLGHAGSSIIGSRVYGQTIDYRNACDAGVEHAIWRLLYGGLGALIPNPGDQIIYQLPETINGVMTTVTVTSNATGGGGVVGSIDKTIIDSFDFDGTYCNTPDIIHVSGNIYAIAYEGSGSDGFLRTVAIAPDGNITNSAIDTLEFDTSDCNNPSIIHVSGEIYAIAYTGSGNDGFLKTMTIAANGDISNSVIDLLEFDPSNGYEPDIVFISGIYYAIAYRGTQNDGFLVTGTIAANGDIGNSVIDTLEFDTSNGYTPDIIHVSGTYFAIAYRGTGSDGFLVTVTIAANGDIGNSVIDTLEFDTSNGVDPYIINTTGNVYAIVYTGPNSDGFIATMTISTAGDISNSVISSYEFDPTNGQEPQIVHIVGNTYAIVYDGPQNDGHLITLPIEANGTIPGTITDSFEYDTSNGYFPDIIIISDGILAIAYCIPSSRGSLVTIGIATSSGGANVYRIRATAGDTAILAHVATDNTTASITFWQVQ